MTVVTSRTFRSGDSAALRLPKDIAYDAGVEVTIIRSGDVLTIYPTRPNVAEMLAGLARLPKPAKVEARDDEALPERPCRPRSLQGGTPKPRQPPATDT